MSHTIKFFSVAGPTKTENEVSKLGNETEKKCDLHVNEKTAPPSRYTPLLLVPFEAPAIVS